MPADNHRLLFRAAVGWTIVGLVGGLAFRELTRSQEFTGFTQLALVHTHALALGTTLLLVLLALTVVLELGSDRRLRRGLITWNAGLAITVVMLAVKGTLQVLDPGAATSKALAGVAGLGHITLTVAIVWILLALGAGVRRLAPAAEPVTQP